MAPRLYPQQGSIRGLVGKRHVPQDRVPVDTAAPVQPGSLAQPPEPGGSLIIVVWADHPAAISRRWARTGRFVQEQDLAVRAARIRIGSLHRAAFCAPGLDQSGEGATWDHGVAAAYLRGKGSLIMRGSRVTTPSSQTARHEPSASQLPVHPPDSRHDSVSDRCHPGNELWSLGARLPGSFGDEPDPRRCPTLAQRNDRWSGPAGPRVSRHGTPGRSRVGPAAPA